MMILMENKKEVMMIKTGRKIVRGGKKRRRAR